MRNYRIVWSLKDGIMDVPLERSRNYRIIWSLLDGKVDAPLRPHDADICTANDIALEEWVQNERDPYLTPLDVDQIEHARASYVRRRKRA